MTLIKDLKKEHPMIYRAALDYLLKEEGHRRDTTDLDEAFHWNDTEEGESAWAKVNDGKFDEFYDYHILKAREELPERFPMGSRFKDLVHSHTFTIGGSKLDTFGSNRKIYIQVESNSLGNKTACIWRDGIWGERVRSERSMCVEDYNVPFICMDDVNFPYRQGQVVIIEEVRYEEPSYYENCMGEKITAREARKLVRFTDGTIWEEHKYEGAFRPMTNTEHELHKSMGFNNIFDDIEIVKDRDGKVMYAFDTSYMHKENPFVGSIGQLRYEDIDMSKMRKTHGHAFSGLASALAGLQDTIKGSFPHFEMRKNEIIIEKESYIDHSPISISDKKLKTRTPSNFIKQ